MVLIHTIKENSKLISLKRSRCSNSRYANNVFSIQISQHLSRGYVIRSVIPSNCNCVTGNVTRFPARHAYEMSLGFSVVRIVHPLQTCLDITRHLIMSTGFISTTSCTPNTRTNLTSY